MKLKNDETNTKRQKSSNSIDENIKGIKNHRKASKHLQASSKFHLEAATHHEERNHQKAEQSTITTYGQITIFNKAQKAGIKQHAIIG